MPGHFSELRLRAQRALLAALALCFAAVSSADASWLRAESQQFIVYSDGDEQHLREVTRTLEEYDGLLRKVSGATKPAPSKLSIYLVRDNKQLREVTPRMSRDVQGLYLATPSNTQTLAVRNDIGGKDWLSAQAILLHEYTHHFTYQYFPANYPAWAAEGLAEYFSAVAFKDDAIEMGHFQKARVYPLRTQPWLPVENLLNPPEDGKGMHMFYPASWLVVHYLMDDAQRRDQLSAYITNVGKGEDTVAAFEKNMGMTVAAFDQVMQDYLDQGQILVRSLPRDKVEPEVQVTAMPASADRMLLAHARFTSESLLHVDGIDRKLGRKLLKQVRKDAAKYPGDALAQRTLAAGEMLYGDMKKADALLDAYIAAKSDDVDGLFLKAARYIIEGRRDTDRTAELFAKAKPLAGEIYKREPNHYAALYIYALGALADGQPPSENTLNVIQLAHQLAPQVDDITLEAAVAMVRAERMTDAKRLLALVAYAPHDTARSSYARTLLERVASGKAIVHRPGGEPRGNMAAAASLK